jgi:hypothetical protein
MSRVPAHTSLPWSRVVSSASLALPPAEPLSLLPAALCQKSPLPSPARKKMTEIVGKAPPSSLGQASPTRRRPTTTRRRRRIRNDAMRAARPNCSAVAPGRTSSLRLSRKRRAKTPRWPRRKGRHHESNVAWPQKREARWLGTLVPCQGLETILAEDKPVVGAPTVKFIWRALCLYLFSVCMLEKQAQVLESQSKPL